MSKVAGVQSIFLLWHVHDLGNTEDDAKLIGVYSSQEDAERAIERMKTKDLPGFRDSPDGFEISEYPINKDHWTEDFLPTSGRSAPVRAFLDAFGLCAESTRQKIKKPCQKYFV